MFSFWFSSIDFIFGDTLAFLANNGDTLKTAFFGGDTKNSDTKVGDNLFSNLEWLVYDKEEFLLSLQDCIPSRLFL